MFNVVTPFSRPENIPALVEHLRPYHVIWHPLIHEPTEFPREDWIKPRLIEVPDEWLDAGAPCYWKCNRVWEGHLDWEDWYCVLCDDDLYGKDFFPAVRRHIRQGPTDAVVVSMQHTDGFLKAAPDNMMPSRIGFEQLIAKGKVWSRYRHTCSPHGDGELYERMFLREPHLFSFCPEAVVLFNALQ
jgi:hypothetical protein